MFVRLNVGPITDPTQQLVDSNMTLKQAIETYHLNGIVMLNGISLDGVDKNTTLAQLGVAEDDYLCGARKNGGN